MPTLSELKTYLARNNFIHPSYNIYGGEKGLHSYGTLGTIFKRKLINLWRKFFIHNTNIDEIETPIITPYQVLKQSGHVDRFTDFVVMDKNRKVYRADHLLKNYFKGKKKLDKLVNQVEQWDENKMSEEINRHKIIVGSQNKPVKVTKTNLMFKIDSNNKQYYMRPELAQGLFVNFKQQLSKRSIPFGLSQIGKSYRKEISPEPLIRLRAFYQAEIEYFYDPNIPKHRQFYMIKDTKIPIISNKMQLDNCYVPIFITAEQLVKNQFVGTEIMAYFLTRIYLFALNIGLDKNKIRFREHLDNELAHYSNECWDLEVLIDDRWIECTGCADRGSFDLRAHSLNISQKARRKLERPITKTFYRSILNRALIGKEFHKASNTIIKHFTKMNQEELKELKNKVLSIKDNMFIQIEETSYQIKKGMIKVEEFKKTVNYEEYYPHVVEPSFGIDRLIMAIFDHNYTTPRKNLKRIVMVLPKQLVPYDIAVLQLYNKENLLNKVETVLTELSKYSCYVDYSSTSIGKRYTRVDEIGIKYTITIDYQTLEDSTVTIRDRDTMEQNRIKIDELDKTMKTLLN